MNYISTKDLSKLRFPDYWNRDPHSWGNVNDWDHYWIGKQQHSGKNSKQDCHTALSRELRQLQQIFADDSHVAYEVICRFKRNLKESTQLLKLYIVRKWCQCTPWLIRQP
ncbi:hypothetical protein BC936DRAFT_143047 [Jimgerdemannia flammicorona]|uniref:Uncharacterized protein n=1 Tax=Jimgerdemannia flammicorona TaxID=994334 RepID=A0A432ZZF3_9FUNG|nr:hypothetical protein BC936DRAFT_143047 [Jimgerdemannia flammicorona]